MWYPSGMRSALITFKPAFPSSSRIRYKGLNPPGKESHVWAEEYNRNWKEIFTVESEVAQIIAGKLNAAITPDEKQIIEKVPTTNLTAYDFYLRGRREQWKFWSNNENREALKNAADLYNNALEYDSSFAQAYIGLASVFLDKHYWETYFSENFLDSVLILADIALKYDTQLSEAYTFRGYYYSQMGKSEQAIEEFDKAIQLNSNDWMAYQGKGIFFDGIDRVEAIYNLHKSVLLNRVYNPVHQNHLSR